MASSVANLTVNIRAKRIPVFVCGGLYGNVLFAEPFIVLGERWLIDILSSSGSKLLIDRRHAARPHGVRISG